MGETNEAAARLNAVAAERAALEARLQNEKGELSERTSADYDKSYARLQRSIAQLFTQTGDDGQRTSLMLELVRLLESKLVYLQNFNVEPSADNRMLASLVNRFLDEAMVGNRAGLTALEATYFRAIVALYAGENEKAAAGFRAACESEESDEENDIKYKSFVILGNLSHEQKDYEGARSLADRSLKYSQNDNVTAQALALKALNSYALKQYDEATSLFEEALQLFDPEKPFFNSYFHRNALLFSGSIYYGKKDYPRADACYRKVLGSVEPASYDHFDALSQIGKIAYATGRLDDAAQFLGEAIERHKFSENEHLVDTCFWLARTQLKRNQPAEAKKLLERIANSEVNYDRKPQAVELLHRMTA